MKPLLSPIKAGSKKKNKKKRRTKISSNKRPDETFLKLDNRLPRTALSRSAPEGYRAGTFTDAWERNFALSSRTVRAKKSPSLPRGAGNNVPDYFTPLSGKLLGQMWRNGSVFLANPTMTRNQQVVPHCARGEKYVRSSFGVHLRFGAWCNWSGKRSLWSFAGKAASEFNSSPTHPPSRDKGDAEIPWNFNLSYFYFTDQNTLWVSRLYVVNS